MERDALTAEAQLVTTEKDAVRLPTNFRNKVISVPVRMIFDNESELEKLIKIKANLKTYYHPGPI